MAAKEAWKKRRTADGSPPSFGTIWNTAEAIRALGRPASPRMRKKMKARAGASRPICAFEPEDKARQHLLHMALIPFASIHPAQFALGRGRSAACERLLQAMGRAEPNSCALLFDGKNFFASISHNWLEDNLPFPKGVIRNLIHTGGMRITPTGRGLARPTDEDIQEAGRRGIPQGSAVSPLVAEMVMTDILRSIADRLRRAVVINYSDNLAILLPEEAGERPAILELLRGAFKAHPAGPFHLTISGPKPLSSPFKFLGYRWVRDGEGRAWAYVDPETLEARATLFRRDISFMRGREDRLRERIKGYQAAFALCADTKAALDAVLDELNDAVRNGM